MERKNGLKLASTILMFVVNSLILVFFMFSLVLFITEPDSFTAYDPEAVNFTIGILSIYIILSIVSIILAISVLKDKEDKNRGLAVAFTVFGFLTSLVAGILMVVYLNNSANATSPNSSEGELLKSKLTEDEHNLSMLQKYKTLLDEGVLTQEEFDAKKKELLKL